MKQVITGFAALALLPSAVEAQDSTYTYLDAESCETLFVEEEGSGTAIGSRCRGYGGWTVFRQADDHGEWTGYSQGQTMPQDLQYGGYVGNFGNYHTVLEWRTDTAGTPFATIHRYYSADHTDDGRMQRVSVLIVTALRPGEAIESCHAGYVHASEVANANVQARLLADDIAPHIDCADHQPFRIDANMPSVIQLISLMH